MQFRIENKLTTMWLYRLISTCLFSLCLHTLRAGLYTPFNRNIRTIYLNVHDNAYLYQWPSGFYYMLSWLIDQVQTDIVTRLDQRTNIWDGTSHKARNRSSAPKMISCQMSSRFLKFIWQKEYWWWGECHNNATSRFVNNTAEMTARLGACANYWSLLWSEFLADNNYCI